MRDFKPIRLRLELKDEYLSDYQKRMLKRYGESYSGDAIIRDILIPSDMPLHNLHYAIQRLFGWQNSHLRRFILPDDIYYGLTKGTVRGWANLVGLLFQPPSEGESDVFWDDDYRSGSINAWLRRKYTGPYVYGGYMEKPEVARRDIQELFDRFPMMDVRESFSDYMKRSEHDKDTKTRIIRRAPLIELTLEEMNSSIILDSGTESLLERLEVDKVIAAQCEQLKSKELFPVTKQLIYNYDFGDNWLITITKYKDCDDLLSQNIIDNYELEQAEQIVLDKHKPVCINKMGLSVLDNVGGLNGFADFLGTLYEDEDRAERTHMGTWSRSLGWNIRKMNIQNIL